MEPSDNVKPQSNNSGCLKTLLIVFITVIVTVLATYWVLTQYIFPKQFDPVELSQQEKTTLDKKIAIFQGWGASANEPASSDSDLSPEKYSEENADRTIELSERELNGLLRVRGHVLP